MERRTSDPDSRARTHLANERTFLAWLRTGLSMVALGLAAAHFLKEEPIDGIPLTTIFALFLVVSGILLIVVGNVHFSRARSDIELGQYRSAGHLVAIGSALALAAGIMGVVLVIALQQSG